MARPVKKLNREQLKEMDQMAEDNCKDYTIANVLGVDVKTLKKHYSKRLIKKRALGASVLRRNQRILAKTNPAMAIFLGKNELAQTDERGMNLKGNVNLAVAIHNALNGDGEKDKK